MKPELRHVHHNIKHQECPYGTANRLREKARWNVGEPSGDVGGSRRQPNLVLDAPGEINVSERFELRNFAVFRWFVARFERLRLNQMLLLKTKRNFREVLQCAFTPAVFLPASTPGETRDVSKARANDIAVDARIAGFGVSVVESKVGELFVLVSSNLSQVVGLGRKLLAESQTAEPWFLLLRAGQGPLVKESADRSHEDCVLNKTGFVVNDRTVEIVAAYVPVQNNTAWCHKLGVNIGETL